MITTKKKKPQNQSQIILNHPYYL